MRTPKEVLIEAIEDRISNALWETDYKYALEEQERLERVLEQTNQRLKELKAVLSSREEEIKELENALAWLKG